MADTQPLVIDEQGNLLDGYPPITYTETALLPYIKPIGPTSPAQPKGWEIKLPLYHRAWEFITDGRGIIYGSIGAIGCGLAYVGYLIITAIISAIHIAAAAVATYGASVLTIIILGWVALALSRHGTKQPDALVLKGCNNGPTPGSHTVKLCNGRHH
ncbi:MAG: hypothetical protein ACREN8_11045 [Candidatus Dormibacteraceae bacterium]